VRLPQSITIDLSPRTLAVVGAICSAALVGIAGGLVRIWGTGRLDLTQTDVAVLLAAGLSAGLAAYTQSRQAPMAPPAPEPPGGSPAPEQSKVSGS
jgi:hypothetical protein